MSAISSIIEVVQYERWWFARCTTCVPARNVSPRDRLSQDAATKDAHAHAEVHLAPSASEPQVKAP